MEVRGLHNVYRVTENLYSGNSPEGDDGFRSLQQLGVRTVISVDGARPDVERARKYGLRYVHLPIGYDGMSAEQGRRLARAVRDLPGPIYLHCHHGRHRGPAAVAVVWRCLDASCGVEQAVAWLKQAGADPRYTGLYALPSKFGPLSTEELDRVVPEFPEITSVTALAALMVDIDERWDHLKQVRAASWRTPPEHPDIDPAHEALLLMEGFREAGRLTSEKQRRDELSHWLTEAEAAARELEHTLRGGKETRAVDRDGAEGTYRRMEAACAKCHARYRDVPRQK
jgi:protein tyrosine phosphatase (PTP) superfamily phosphohydrolase (DUF442 family)